MNKLYKFKSWYSAKDAAKRLSCVLQEPVRKSDVLQLVDEGHLAVTYKDDKVGFSTQALEAFEAQANHSYTSKPDLSSKERNSLLKIIIGMAVDGYGYDPKASRSPAAREISACLLTRGISVDEDTIRKWLNQAKEICDVSLVKEH